MRPLKYALACTLLAVAAPGARAQFGPVDAIMKNLDAIAGYWVYSGFLPHSSVLSGGKIGQAPRQSGVQGPGIGFMFRMAATPDSAWTFSMVLAYTRMTEFRSQDPSFEIRGSIQELPRVAWFAQYHPKHGAFTPYGGAHFGLVQLVSVSIYDSTGALYPVGGSTYEVGAALGGAFNLKAGTETFMLFVEPGYTLRNVVNLDWAGANNKVIPLRFPRSLRFTGWEIAAGVAFGIPRGIGGH